VYYGPATVPAAHAKPSASRYQARGVSATKHEVHGAIATLHPGLFPLAFCKITEDYLTGDPEIEGRMREAMASPAATFNFLGRFDGARAAEPPILAAVPWPVGAGEAPRRRDPQLRVTAWVVGEPSELRLTFEYGRDFYRIETIERLAQGTMAALRRAGLR